MILSFSILAVGVAVGFFIVVGWLLGRSLLGLALHKQIESECAHRAQPQSKD